MMINKRLLNLCPQSKKYIGLTVFSNWLSFFCNVLIILNIGAIINKIFNLLNEKGESLKEYNLILNIKNQIIAIGILIILRFIFNMLFGYYSRKSSENVKIKIRDLIYKKLLKLGLNYNEVESTSSIVQISIEGVEALEIYFGKYLPQLFYSLLAPITLFIILSFISFKSAIVFILCVPLIPMSIILIMKFAKKILKEYWNNYSNLGDTFLENLQGLTTLKVFNIGKERHKKMNEEAEHFRKVTMKVLSMQLNSITVMDLVAFTGAALGTIVALIQFKNGFINLGNTLVIILLSSEFFIPLRLLGSFFHIAMNGMAASDKIFNLLDSKERKKDNKNNYITLEETAIDNDSHYKNLITLNDITFSYDGERSVLSNISMDIKEKSFTAIVGQSGSGKSTVASLILNNYKVQKGNILLKNKDVNHIPFDNIYENIGLISTNSYIFNGTILDNILIGKKDSKEEEIKKALKKANLYDFVKSLEKGLDTNVGEGGSLLSGGQKQRLALARAILANREIMIFDEATSNIDVESEELIWNSINELSKEKTIIVISHRLANVVSADKIYVLDKGKLIEEGTHIELIKNKGKYLTMINEQNILEGKAVI